MIKGVKVEELDVARFDGYANYPFIGESAHLRETTTP
jgi:hypothetical protein